MKWRNAKTTATGAIDAEILHQKFGWIPTTIDAGDTGAEYDAGALHGEIIASGLAAAYMPPSAAQIATDKAAQVRGGRAGRIAATDWTQLSDTPLSAAQVALWATYRQALRDVTKQKGFPATVVWPVAPK